MAKLEDLEERVEQLESELQRQSTTRSRVILLTEAVEILVQHAKFSPEGQRAIKNIMDQLA
jgi:hypothetical protein